MGYVLDIAERESEVIAPKREREGERELGTERVPATLEGVSPKVDFGHVCQYLTVLKSIIKIVIL